MNVFENILCAKEQPEKNLLFVKLKPQNLNGSEPRTNKHKQKDCFYVS